MKRTRVIDDDEDDDDLPLLQRTQPNEVSETFLVQDNNIVAEQSIQPVQNVGSTDQFVKVSSELPSSTICSIQTSILQNNFGGADDDDDDVPLAMVNTICKTEMNIPPHSEQNRSSQENSVSASAQETTTQTSRRDSASGRSGDRSVSQPKESVRKVKPTLTAVKSEKTDSTPLRDRVIELSTPPPLKQQKRETKSEQFTSSPVDTTNTSLGSGGAERLFKEGQRIVCPPKGDGQRAFYESLLSENPNSLMAIKYCIEAGVLMGSQLKRCLCQHHILRQLGAFRPPVGGIKELYASRDLTREYLEELLEAAQGVKKPRK